MKFIKIILVIIFILICFSYFNKSFFDFDEIEYYHKNIAEEDLIKFLRAEEKLKTTQFSDIVINDYPKTVNENFYKLLAKNGFTKLPLNSDKYQEINDIFSKSICLTGVANACVPIYRDILIFKKNKKTVGIAKVCFACQQHHIVGSRENTNNFGNCGDYEELESILK